MNPCLKKSKTNFFSPNGTFTECYPYKGFATKALRRKNFNQSHPIPVSVKILQFFRVALLSVVTFFTKSTILVI